MFTFVKSTTGDTCGSYFLLSSKFFGTEHDSRIKIGYNIEWFLNENIKKYWFIQKI